MEEMLMAAGNTNNINNQNRNPPPAAAAAQGAQPQTTGAPPAAAAGAPAAGAGERRARPQKEKALNCPRCNSTNTKFCYYNNYSLQQPRYFCKTCRRYWTEGGSLRNVPVGGGSRKNKRSASSAAAVSSAAVSSAAAIPVGAGLNKNPKLMHDDLNLAFPHHPKMMQQAPPEFAAFPSLESSSVCGNPGNGNPGNGRVLSAMELLRSTGCYVPLQHVHHQLGTMPAEYAGFAAALGGDFRSMPSHSHHQSLLGFSLDTGTAGGYSAAGLQESAAAGRLLFPFEDLKPAVHAAAAAAGGATNNNNNGGAAADQYEHSNKDQQAGAVTGGHDSQPGFWSNSILGNGTSNGGGGPW